MLTEQKLVTALFQFLEGEQLMYRYRGPRHRMRRLGGFPFVLPFIIFFISRGSFGALVASFLVVMILFLIARALMGSLFGPPMTGNYQQQQYYQPPYQP